MEYILNPNQIDKLMKPYWDMHFDNSHIGEIRLSGEKWQGLIKKDSDGLSYMLLGHPKGREDMMWYNDGPRFDGGEKLFSISRYDFNQSMKRYVKNRFDVEANDIM